MPLRPETTTYQHPSTVPIADLERELRRLWQTTQDEGSRGGVRITRACMLNMAVFCTDEESVQEACETIPELTREHPCRALIIHAAPDYSYDRDEAPVPDTAIEARISTFCHLAGPDRQVCCEQIVIRAEGRAIQALPGVMAPLFMPDLPTVLWWRACRAIPALPRRLFSLFDTMIVDARQWEHPEQDMPRVAGLAARPAHRPRLLDLTWTRTAPWREAIAELFDPPEALALLPAIRRLTIEAPCHPAGMLLAGWLRSRLPGPCRSEFIRVGRASSPPCGSGFSRDAVVDITACHLETDADPPARFSVEYDGALQLRTILPGRPERTQTLPYPELDLGAALCGALETLHGDPLLDDALRAM